MSKHPPFTIDDVVAAGAGAMPNLPGDALLAVAIAIAPVLWREWTRGMAVVPLPGPDEEFQGGTRFYDAIATSIGDTAKVAQHGHIMSPTQAREKAGRLLAAADRAEQLAAESKAVT